MRQVASPRSCLVTLRCRALVTWGSGATTIGELEPHTRAITLDRDFPRRAVCCTHELRVGDCLVVVSLPQT